MALIPESAVHDEIKERLLRIGWEDGNEKFKIEEHKMVADFSGLEGSLGGFVPWNVLEKNPRAQQGLLCQPDGRRREKGLGGDKEQAGILGRD